MAMIEVKTHQEKDRWHCTATFNGYDYDFESGHLDASQQIMQITIHNSGIPKSHFRWLDPVYYRPTGFIPVRPAKPAAKRKAAKR